MFSANVSLLAYQAWSFYQQDKVKDNFKIVRYLAKFAKVGIKAAALYLMH